ncbi:hypothetical protein RRG08_014582 [Elysia crispata]|uniref:Uncharacterized protein n=1 Tax=Elysia crispata TaxID=231223 RepID=A0AAE0YSF7_9GAST|nr:hypothetical protein RRG08_014582 [Elysia crispata]
MHPECWRISHRSGELYNTCNNGLPFSMHPECWRISHRSGELYLVRTVSHSVCILSAGEFHIVLVNNTVQHLMHLSAGEFHIVLVNCTTLVRTVSHPVCILLLQGQAVEPNNSADVRQDCDVTGLKSPARF